MKNSTTAGQPASIRRAQRGQRGEHPDDVLGIAARAKERDCAELCLQILRELAAPWRRAGTLSHRDLTQLRICADEAVIECASVRLIQLSQMRLALADQDTFEMLV